MKKVLLISNYQHGLGGISAQVDLLCEYLRNEGYDVAIFTTKGNPIVRLWLFIKLVYAVRRCDMLHIHGCSGWGMLPVVYGVIAGKIWRKKIIVTYHGGEAAEYFKNHGAFARRWMNRADKVIVLSGYLEKVFNEYRIPCVVIPNIAKLSETKEHSAYQWDAPRFISVRHMRELYNIPCILRAFQRVQKQLPQACLTILGTGPLLNELQQYVLDNKMEHVTFVGQVPNNEMKNYLAAHDVFLSAPKLDNMPVSIMEAMHSGVLVISSNVGGVPYMIEDGHSGLLFDYDDDKELAEQMVWVAQHPKESEIILTAAHKEVQRYSWNEVKKQLLPVYG